MLVILSSLSTSFSFYPELDDTVLFNIDGIPYCPQKTPKDREFLEEMKILCHEKLKEAAETGYSIILINNTPLTLEVLKEIQDVSAFPFASSWLILSFFHKDKSLVKNKIKVTDDEYQTSQNSLNQNKTCRISASLSPIQEAASVLFSCYKAEHPLELPVPSPMQAQSFLHGYSHERRCINCLDGYKPFFGIYVIFPQSDQGYTRSTALQDIPSAVWSFCFWCQAIPGNSQSGVEPSEKYTVSPPGQSASPDEIPHILPTS
jgi:hypothetical protein